MVCVDPDKLEEKVDADFQQNYTNFKYLTGRVIDPTNDMIPKRNFKLIQNEIPGKMNISYNRDECVEDNDQMYKEDVLNKVKVSGIPPHQLPFKKWCCHAD